MSTPAQFSADAMKLVYGATGPFFPQTCSSFGGALVVDGSGLPAFSAFCGPMAWYTATKPASRVRTAITVAITGTRRFPRLGRVRPGPEVDPRGGAGRAA